MECLPEGEFYFCPQIKSKNEKADYYFIVLIRLRISACTETTALQLSLKDAEKIFLERNPSLIAERYNIDMAQAQVTQARLFENPVISLEQNVYNRLNGKYFDMGKEGEATAEIEQVINPPDNATNGYGWKG